MLTKSQITEIKKHLERAQSPIFFFDNDQDGLCSFLLLQRFIGRGKGIPIKSFPEMTVDYFRRVHELKADYIFILDKHAVSDEFFKEAKKTNIPVVWIDHHIVEKKKVPENVSYYNPVFNKKKGEEPVTALCYQISNRKEDIWLAVIGCIADVYLPNFYEQFEKLYPELVIKSRNVKDIFYKSQIGKVSKILSFGLKDRTTNVINMIRFLMRAKSPYEILEENSKNYTMHQRYNQIESKYQILLKKAVSIENKKEKILFFQYGGDLSISGDLSNELIYKFPEKIIVVIYVKGIKANISMRGKHARMLLSESIKDIEDATGGGHEEAVGGQMKVEDIERFRLNLEKVVLEK